MLIPPIPAYPQQQTPRIPLLPYTTEKNQQQRQSQRSISPTHKRADDSEDDKFLDEIIPGITMPQLPLYMSDIESAQRIWQNRGYDLLRDPSVIKYKNSKWHSKLATQKPFTFRDWREFWNTSLRALMTSYGEMNRLGYMKEKDNMQQIMGNDQNGREQTRHSLRQKRKRNRIVAAAAVAAVTVAVIATKYKKIGQGKETWKFHEPMEMRTSWRMMNAIDKRRKRDRSNLIRNNRLRTNNNPNHDNHKWKKIQKQIKTKFMGNTQVNPSMDLSYISPLHNTPPKPSSSHSQQHSPSPSLEETLAILRAISPGDPRGYKEKEPESKQLKLQQYIGLMDVIERIHGIMKPIIEEEKKKPQAMLPGQYKHYPNKDGPAFFYPPKNHRPTPITRPKGLNFSEEQWNDGVAGLIKIYPQIYQSIPDAVIGLIICAAEQIVQSETQSKNQEQFTNETERIVADGTDDNEDNDQSEHAIEPKNFTNGNDRLRKNDSGTQLQAIVNGEANPKINITKTSANTPPHNVNGSD
ncbi:MAG: hypothetical protein EZS28_010391 [Streblomastix strix]|uniref:Uncharacterized protein n=1 Tax=Streblomastix strix TaxID=222440 RepID=A0A5J4WIE4_9EUKA|nr:MAG: hypothetical protein EZS28_010388 [Streblomastix strix]KAA6394085.1 MAG: hypothetical protein EZS28_010391 [Streblomastix strix]